MSEDFRQIAVRNESGRSDKLFRAAISAFCALTRPARREIVQLEELCLQLYDAVSADALRYGSAALSECAYAPAALVQRLADEPIEIAAPLLLKSEALTEIDLIAIIGRHGAGHARVIARRQALPAKVTALIEDVAAASPSGEPASKGPAEEARGALRRMMRPSALDPAGASPDDYVYGKLRATALSGTPAFFHAALADALAISLAHAAAIVSASDRLPLYASLKALGLTVEQAYMLLAAVAPTRFPHAAAIRAFAETYERIEFRQAVEALRLLQADAVFSAMARKRNTRVLRSAVA